MVIDFYKRRVAFHDNRDTFSVERTAKTWSASGYEEIKMPDQRSFVQILDCRILLLVIPDRLREWVGKYCRTTVWVVWYRPFRQNSPETEMISKIVN